MKNVSMIHQRKQTGAVSIFMVVFAMLLMSVVTISFLRIMTKDQSQASGNDLAQSAYDSAQAGVEDAKRALVWYTERCKVSSAACTAAADTIVSPTCNAAIRAANGMPSGQGEIKVQQSTAVDASGDSIDRALDQAYTCVTMQLNTDDYLANIPANNSILIPLTSTQAFNTVTIQWFSVDDLPGSGTRAAPDTSPLTANSRDLLTQANWPASRPSVLRAQFMQVGSSFRMSDFDTTTTDSKSNANTVFLYPSTSGGSATELITRDVRGSDINNKPQASATSAPFPTRCVEAIPSGGYSCSLTLTLPTPVGASDRSSAQSYLRLSTFYVGSHVRITLGGAQFKGVQPIVDSTGRASDVFRRVESRIDLFDTTAFPYPAAAVETNGSLCKDFGVTNDRYIAGTCTP